MTTAEASGKNFGSLKITFKYPCDFYISGHHVVITIVFEYHGDIEELLSHNPNYDNVFSIARFCFGNFLIYCIYLAEFLRNLLKLLKKVVAQE